MADETSPAREAKFSRSSRNSVDIKFAQLALLSSGAIVSLSSDPAVLRRHLNPDFRKALAERESKQLPILDGSNPIGARS